MLPGCSLRTALREQGQPFSLRGLAREQVRCRGRRRGAQGDLETDAEGIEGLPGGKKLLRPRRREQRDQPPRLEAGEKRARVLFSMIFFTCTGFADG